MVRHNQFSLRGLFIALTVCCIIAGGCVGACRYLDYDGEPIRIVLPKGYSGDFAIVRDSSGGTSPAWRNGAWEYKIPVDGKLAANDLSPFFKWHKELYQYEDGTAVDGRQLDVTGGPSPTSRSVSSTDYDGTTIRFRVAKWPPP